MYTHNVTRPTICCNDQCYIEKASTTARPRAHHYNISKRFYYYYKKSFLYTYRHATICMMLLCVHMCPKRTYNLRICVCVCVQTTWAFFSLLYVVFFSGSPNPTRLSLLFCTAQPRTFHLSHRFWIYVYFSVAASLVYISHALRLICIYTWEFTFMWHRKKRVVNS